MKSRLTLFAITIAFSIAGLCAEPALAGTAPAPDPASRIFIVSAEELSSRPHEVVRTVVGRTCTLRLRRPADSENPLAVLASQRMLQHAAQAGADAVTGVRCAREISIGTGCPTSVSCEGKAVKFK